LRQLEEGSAYSSEHELEVDDSVDSMEMRRLEKWNQELDNEEPLAAEDTYMLDNL
jgi:hypothetical protein